MFAVLVLASLLIITIQAENAALSSIAADIPSLVTERWGANSTAEYPANTIDATLNSLNPDWSANNGTTLIIRSGGGYDGWALLYFDVSNLPVTTTVGSASLHLYMYAHCQCDVYETVHQVLDPDGLGLWDEDEATFNRRRPGVPWSNTAPGDLSTVIGPELDRVYLGTHGQWSHFWAEWDVTAAVQDWLANPAANSGLLLPHIEDALYTADSSESANAELRPYLQITYEGPNPDRPAQASGLDVFHRSGQTFITWEEIGSGDPSEAYRVYRHHQPITASNTSTGLSAGLDQATLLAEVPAGSGYYEHEDVGCSAGSNCSPIGQTRFIIEDNGAPLPEGRGLFVFTVPDSEQLTVNSQQLTVNSQQSTVSAGNCSLITDHCSPITDHYYAVTSVVQGNENRQDFSAENALTVGVSESEATPQPVRVWTNDTDTGWVYTQFMDYYHWNPAYEDYAYNFYVGVPPGYDPDGDPIPFLLQLHAYTGSYRLPWSSSAGSDYDWPVIQVFPDDRSNTWWYGFGELLGHEAPLRDGLIVNYTEQRLEQIIDWVISQFNVDLDRVYLWGGSMGGSGTLLFGLRHGDLFAAIYAESGMTDFATSGEAGGANWVTDVDWRWGTPEENIATNHGPGIWDWYNLQDWVRDNPGTELPFLADHHGQNDDVIDWETQGLPWYPALEEGRHGFVGVFDGAGHSWPGFVAGSSVFALTDFNFRRDESFPALSNASNSDDPASSTGCRNCYIEWSSSWNNFAGPPTDTAELYELVIRTTDGGEATVDVTPRRFQQFVVTPGQGYNWENERLSDSAVVQSGTVVVDQHGLITVPAFAVNSGGNRLRLGSFAPAQTMTPTATPTITPTPTGTLTPSRREFPDTSAGIHVFNDQLAGWSMTEAQFEFAATHYAGTQKMIRSHTQHLRSYNPDFIVLHYRLGLGLGYRGTEGDCNPTGSYINIIEGDSWVQEWPGEATVQDSWFFPYAGSDRVLQCTWGWYLMELDDPSWRAYWMGEVLRQLAANENDGLFADSFSVPNVMGGSTYEPDLPAYDPAFESEWATRIEEFIDYVQAQFAGQYYLIPNVGYWVTTRNPTDYSNVDGVMIEGFSEWGPGNPFVLSDWQLQMNRILSLTQQDKVLILQSYVEPPLSSPPMGGTEGGEDRLFNLANYLLVKGVHSFINLDLGLEPEWFPEYEIPIGSPVDPLPADIDDYLDPSGLYRRDYTNGLALVNPGTEVRTIDLGGTYYLATPSGGGLVPDDADTSAWTVNYAPVTSVTLNPHQGAILLVMPPCDLDGDLDGDYHVNIMDVMLVASRWGMTSTDPDWDPHYELNDDGNIDSTDIMLVVVNWGEDCTPSTATPTPTATTSATPSPSATPTATGTPTPTPTATSTAVIPSRLIQPTDLVYRGAFAYPSGDDWTYGGHALAYYPEGDPTGPTDGYPGSLYAAGHAWYDLVGEITIPEPVVSDDFDDLPKASVLRPLADITEGWKDNCTYNDDCIYREVGGLEYLSNIDKIVWNLRDWYNVAGYNQDSLGWSELDMTAAQGVWHIGERGNDVFHNAKTCNYLFKAPESFASENLDEKWLIAGNHRGVRNRTGCWPMGSDGGTRVGGSGRHVGSSEFPCLVGTRWNSWELGLPEFLDTL